MVAAPFASIAYWGGSYLLDCMHTLEAPGVPIEFTYQSKGGTLTLSASSFAFSLSRGILYLDHPKVLNPKGELVVELGSAMATGLDLTRGSDQIVKVTASDLKGRVVREKDGRFDFLDYLPSTTTSQNPTPFDARIDRCEIDVVDRTAGTEWTRRLVSPQVKIAGLGKDWVATAHGTIPGVGSLDAKIERTAAQGVQVSATTDGLQVAELLSHFKETPDGRADKDLAPLQVASLYVSGPIRLYLPSGARPNVELRVKGTAAGVRYGKYQVDKATFTGLAEMTGFKGSVEVTVGKNAGFFQGSAAWRQAFSLSGAITASAPGPGSLPSWASGYLPKDASFSNGRFKGWVSVGPQGRYRLVGEADATGITYAQETVNAPSVDVDVADGRVLVDIQRAAYKGQAAIGAFTFDTKNRTVQGTASVAKLNLATVARKFGYTQIEGEAYVSATLDGPISKPNVSFLTHGHGNVTLPKEHVLSLGQFEGVGRYENGALLLDRAYFDTPEGLVTAHGALGSEGNLGLTVAARGIRLSVYSPDLDGTANLEATIAGSLKSPHATGRFEAYNLSYQDQSLPAAAANFSVDRSLLQLDQIEAARGTTSLAGSVKYRLKSKDITGMLAVHDVQMADWLGDEYVGAVDVPSIEISGTADNPIVDATVKGASLVARGIKLDSLSGTLRSVGHKVSLTNLTVNAANGSLTAKGTYDLDTRAGSVTASANGLALDQLAPEISDTVVLGGHVSGDITAAIADNKISHATLDGRLAGVSVNGLAAGSGFVQVDTDGKIVTGSGQIGDLERYVSLDGATYDPKSKIFTGSFDLYNLRAENLISEAVHYIPDADPDIRDDLQHITGLITASGKIDGPIDDLSLQVENLTASQLEFRKDPFGTLDAAFSRDGHKWAISSFKLSNGPATVALSGTIDENGPIKIDSDADNQFDLSKLGDFDPRLSGVTGTAHLWFEVDGETKAPHIAASVMAKNLLALPGSGSAAANDPDRNLTINLEKIDVSSSNGKSGGIQAKGDFSYRGLQGTIAASVPFQYPFKVAADGPASATIEVAPSDLKTIAALTGGIDAKRTDGTVSGSILIQGDAKDLSATGSLSLKADTLAFQSADDTLKDVAASLALTPTEIQLTGSGASSRSGTFTASISMPIGGLTQLLDTYRQGGTSALLDRPVTGKATVDKFLFKDVLRQVTGTVIQNGVSKSLTTDAAAGSGSLSADLTLAGTIRAPAIGGAVKLSSGDITLYGFTVGESASHDYPINPRFDLKLSLSDPSRLRSSTADMRLLGEGTLQGSLQYPRVNGSLYVEDGTVRLPAALVRLQQGGTVKIGYQTSNIQTTATAAVDLEGNTSVTAPRYADSTDIQRYDITLFITGDLLQQQGLSVRAESDPPDLAQDRIMAILGQADVLQSLSNGSRQSGAVSAALGFAVPSILDPLTSQIARGIGFDYLNLEYNTFDQASVAFGKALGAGFSVVGSHELSQPPPGFPSRYDLRIVYRPRRLPGALSRLSFFFGADQDRPWKVGLDYGFRF